MTDEERERIYEEEKARASAGPRHRQSGAPGRHGSAPAAGPVPKRSDEQVQRRAHAPWTSSTTTPHCLPLTRQHAIDQKDQIAPESDKLKSPRRGRLVVARRRSMTAGANGAGSFPWPHRVRPAGSSSAKGARP